MSDKKTEGFDNYIDRISKENNMDMAWYPDLARTVWNHLTEKYEKEVVKLKIGLNHAQGLDESIDELERELQAANKELELLTKCVEWGALKNGNCFSFYPDIDDHCQGCKNKQLIDNEFSGGEYECNK